MLGSPCVRSRSVSLVNDLCGLHFSVSGEEVSPRGAQGSIIMRVDQMYHNSRMPAYKQLGNYQQPVPGIIGMQVIGWALLILRV